MNPARWLIRAAHLAPDAPALLAGDKVQADYCEFARRAGAIGAALKSRYGIVAGDRVAIFMTNHTEYLEALYGIWFLGAVAVPINAKLHPKEAAWIISNAGARLAFVSNDVGAALAQTAPGCLETLITVDRAEFGEMYRAKPLDTPAQYATDDLLWLFYTSGTTGKPKGVMLSAGNILAMTLGYFADVDEVASKDCILYAAPMSHGAGIYNFMFVIKAARHAVPLSGGFDAGEILTLAPKLGNVSMFAAPTMVKRLVEAARQTGGGGQGIKTITYAGGPMYVADIIDAGKVMGNRFIQFYGQGECPMAITVLPRALVSARNHPNWRARLGSVGVAQSPVLVRVVDVAGKTLPLGEIGEIVVFGPTVMLGYWQNEAATAKALRDGWLWTGDMGAMDADGFLTLHDRSKDMIISGGSNIYPREIEEVLLTLPEVAEVAVVGKPDLDWGEIVVAFVVAAPGAEPSVAAMDAHCIENIARFKRPKEYRMIAALPKNNYGKVLKTALRELAK